MKKKRERTITVNDRMQKNYAYVLTAPIGRKFAAGFVPELTPAQMLELGVFGGRYLRDCRSEFPASWFKKAKLHPDGVPGHSKDLNFFKVDASQSLEVWNAKGWVNPIDPRGWFQWYCRYYLGRRVSEEDARQIKRWRAICRHIAQLKWHCKPGDWTCRPVQRQALLHWAYDSRRM